MVMKREKMMSELRQKWGVKFVRPVEEFDDDLGDGIWMSGENGETNADGWELFDYGNENYDQYEFGVHNSINEWADENGWCFEWNDPGTIMLWPHFA
jgi:hypothetical protein